MKARDEWLNKNFVVICAIGEYLTVSTVFRKKADFVAGIPFDFVKRLHYYVMITDFCGGLQMKKQYARGWNNACLEEKQIPGHGSNSRR
jgi:hypothetical protein